MDFADEGKGNLKMSYSLDHKCRLCGQKKGKHQAKTFNCPATKHAFTHFLTNQVFLPSDKMQKPKFKI